MFWRALELRPSQGRVGEQVPGRRQAGRGDRPRGAGSCPRGRPSSHPPRRAPPGRFARRGRCERPGGASPGDARRPGRARSDGGPARRSTRLRSCGGSAALAGLAGRKVECFCLRLQPRQVESMRPREPRVLELIARMRKLALDSAIEHDRLHSLAAFPQGDVSRLRSRARPRIRARCISRASSTSSQALAG